MEQFSNYLLSENKLDLETRIKAIELKDKIISGIKNGNCIHSQEFKGIKNVFPIQEFVHSIEEKYKSLKIKFSSQLSGSYGRYYVGLQVIALFVPNSLLNETEICNGGYKLSDETILWISKPDTERTLFHEIIHFLDDIKTQSRIYKSKKEYPTLMKTYYNDIPEYNAFLNEFLYKIQKINLDKDTILYLLSQENWFKSLTDKLKRNTLKRVANYIQETT